MKQVKFTQMKHGDRADYELLERLEQQYIKGLPDRIIQALQALETSLSGYQVSRLTHCLQSASMAWRAGADIDWVVCALVHDIGDGLAPYSHDKLAADVLRPFVREQCTWVVEHHFDFQKIYFMHFFDGNPNARDQHRDSPYFDDCSDFCEHWDQSAFDPDYDHLPLSFFKPMLEQVFTREAFAANHLKAGSREPLFNADVAVQRG